MTYTMKGLKTWKGMDGLGWEASLYKDGKKLGLVMDEVSGGEVRVDVSAEAYAELHIYVESTYTPDGEYPELGPDVGTFLGGLADKVEMETKLKRLLAKKTYVVFDHSPGKFSMLKTKFTPEVAKGLKAKYPEGMRILNELPIAEAAKAYYNDF